MLKNLVTLVSGAASGIGKATAKEFLKQGARALVACDIDFKTLEDTCNEFSKEFKDAKILPLKVDVTKRADIENMVNETVKNFKQLDVAFNNAGIVNNAQVPFHELPLEEHERVLAVNLNGVLTAMHYEIKQMLSQPKGDYSIVNTASIAGGDGLACIASYCASKHALLGLTKAVAMENAKKGIRVNCVSPGFIATPLVSAVDAFTAYAIRNTPMGRLGKPEEIAKVVAFLSSKEASYITGTTIYADGGWMTGKE